MRLIFDEPARWVKKLINPREFLRWVRKKSKPKLFLNRFKYRSLQYYYRLSSPKRNLISKMNWDNLIVLDACRFDVLSQLNDIPGKLSKIISAGSSTPEWLRNNFANARMKDVVYISANPFGSYYYIHKKFGHIPFYKIIEVWKDGWSEELKTVHPSAVNDATLESLHSDPDKRHLIHYMQPHHPFIGDVKIKGSGIKTARDRSLSHGSDNTQKKPIVWDLVSDGLVGLDQVWKAYISNLRLVLNYVKKLLPIFVGKTCITSDHGNTFGRFGVFYAHYGRTPLPELIEVPYLEVSR